MSFASTSLAGERPPTILPILVEHVPPQGRMLSLFERQEGLSDWGLRGARSSRTTLRVERLPGQEDLFALVRYRRSGSGWRRNEQPWRLTWQAPLIRARVLRGDRSSWLTADDLARDPVLLGALIHAPRRRRRA